MTTTSKPYIGWRNGRYFYCLSHAPTQVFGHTYFTEDEEGMWAGRKCDWCKAKIKETAQ